MANIFGCDDIRGLPNGIIDETELDISDVPTDIAPIKPKEWFAKNPAKPALTTDYYSLTVDLTNLAGSLERYFSNGKLTLRMAKAYLYTFFSHQVKVLPEDWSSFKIPIGKAGESISPWAPLEIALKQELQVEIRKELECDPRALALAILSYYRTGCLRNEEHKERIAELISVKISAWDVKLTIKGRMEVYKAWVHDEGFRRMVASIDMFYHKFRDSDLGYFRMGTVSTRFKDCTALTSMNYFAKITGSTFIGMLPWFWTKELSYQVYNVVEGGNELEKLDSYAPYFIEMTGAMKSAYSATVNPELYMFIHIIGVTLGHIRSYNANKMKEYVVTNTFANAIIVAALLTKSGPYSMYYESKKAYAERMAKLAEKSKRLEETKAALQAQTAAGAAPPSGPSSQPAIPVKRVGDSSTVSGPAYKNELSYIRYPKTTDARAHYNWFVENYCMIPDWLFGQLAVIWRTIKDPRAETVAAYLAHEAEIYFTRLECL